jgi:hypothetical protein
VQKQSRSKSESITPVQSISDKGQRRVSWANNRVRKYLLSDIAEEEEDSVPSNSLKLTPDSIQYSDCSAFSDDLLPFEDKNHFESPVGMNCEDSSPEDSNFVCLKPVPMLISYIEDEPYASFVPTETFNNFSPYISRTKPYLNTPIFHKSNSGTKEFKSSLSNPNNLVNTPDKSEKTKNVDKIPFSPVSFGKDGLDNKENLYDTNTTNYPIDQKHVFINKFNTPNFTRIRTPMKQAQSFTKDLLKNSHKRNLSDNTKIYSYIAKDQCSKPLLQLYNLRSHDPNSISELFPYNFKDISWKKDRIAPQKPLITHPRVYEDLENLVKKLKTEENALKAAIDTGNYLKQLLYKHNDQLYNEQLLITQFEETNKKSNQIYTKYQEKHEKLMKFMQKKPSAISTYKKWNLNGTKTIKSQEVKIFNHKACKNILYSRYLTLAIDQTTKTISLIFDKKFYHSEINSIWSAYSRILTKTCEKLQEQETLEYISTRWIIFLKFERKYSKLKKIIEIVNVTVLDDESIFEGRFLDTQWVYKVGYRNLEDHYNMLESIISTARL